MIPVKLYIPHMQNGRKNEIQTSPYHRWEHIFVRILQNMPEIKIISVYGSTDCEKTQILLILNDALSVDHLKLYFRILRYRIPSKAVLKRETIIINSELSCLSQLYDHKKMLCEEGKPLTQMEMLEFRKLNYDWDEADVIYDYKSLPGSKNKVNYETPQVLIAEKRSSLMKNLKHWENNEKMGIGNEEGFFLFRLCKDVQADIPINIWKMAIEEMDAANGFLIKRMRDRWALSFLIWPSWEEENDFIGLQVFTFIKYANVKIFWNILCDWLYYYLRNIDINWTIKEYLNDYVDIYN